MLGQIRWSFAKRTFGGASSVINPNYGYASRRWLVSEMEGLPGLKAYALRQLQDFGPAAIEAVPALAKTFNHQASGCSAT